MSLGILKKKNKFRVLGRVAVFSRVEVRFGMQEEQMQTIKQVKALKKNKREIP